MGLGSGEIFGRVNARQDRRTEECDAEADPVLQGAKLLEALGQLQPRRRQRGPAHQGRPSVGIDTNMLPVPGRGPVRGIAHMINEDRQCVDVLTQIAAVQAALDKVALCLLDDHVRGRLVEADVGGEPDALSNEVLAAVARLRRRG